MHLLLAQFMPPPSAPAMQWWAVFLVASVPALGVLVTNWYQHRGKKLEAKQKEDERDAAREVTNEAFMRDFLRGELASRDAKVNALEAKIVEAAEKRHAIANELNGVKLECAATMHELKDENALLKEELRLIRCQHESLQGKYDAQQAELDKLEATNAQQQEQMDAMKAENTQLKQELQALRGAE